MENILYTLKLQQKFALYVGITIKKLFLFLTMALENTNVLFAITKVSLISIKIKQNRHVKLSLLIQSATLITIYMTITMNKLYFKLLS